MLQKEDNELVYEVTHGSKSSFEILVDRYQTTVFNLLVKLVHDDEAARDLTQDVFVAVFEKMGSFNYNYRFFSWIYRIALNTGINYLKSRKQFEGFHNLESQSDTDAGDTAKECRTRKLQKGMRDLRADFRSLILLKYFFGLSYQEISEVLEIPEKKVKAHLFEAREHLRIILLKRNFFEND